MKDKMYQRIAALLPNRLLYFTVIHVWARATTTRYTNKTPDQVTVWDALDTL